MNIRIISLLFIFVLVAVLGVLQQLAFENYLYWKFWWYDVLMHFLGGVVVGSVYLWVVQFEFSQSFLKYTQFVSVFLFVLVIGILWEVYEGLIGVDRGNFSLATHLIDTSLDLVMDVLGGTLSYVVFSNFIRK